MKIRIALSLLVLAATLGALLEITDSWPQPISKVELSGQAIDITTGKPVPKVYVSVFQSGEHPLAWVPDGPWGSEGIGAGMVKTDENGQFHYKSPSKLSILKYRRATVYWYHPCFRSPTSHRTPYSYYSVFETYKPSSSSVKPAGWNRERTRFGAVQDNLVLKVWPENKAMEYTDGAEYDPEYAKKVSWMPDPTLDPEYGKRINYRLTSRWNYLDNVGVLFGGGNFPEHGSPEIKVGWAIFWIDYQHSKDLADKYLYAGDRSGLPFPEAHKFDRPIPEGEPLSPFDCSKPIPPQLPEVMDRMSKLHPYNPETSIYRGSFQFSRIPDPFEEVDKYKAEVLEALKAFLSEEQKTEND